VLEAFTCQAAACTATTAFGEDTCEDREAIPPEAPGWRHRQEHAQGL